MRMIGYNERYSETTEAVLLQLSLDIPCEYGCERLFDIYINYIGGRNRTKEKGIYVYMETQ